MGLVTSFLGRSNRPPSDIFVDFENAKLDNSSSRVAQKIRNLMSNSGAKVLDNVKTYGKGAKKFAGEAIASKVMKKKVNAFIAALPWIDRIKGFSDFSRELGQLVPGLCKELITAGDLEQQQALAKLLADTFEFIVSFDSAKLMTPAIQNDFSFYRRMYSKMAAVEEASKAMKVSDEDANMISMFIAQPTPMIISLVNSLKSLGASQLKGILELLGTMSNILCSVVMCKKFASDATNEYCMRAMVGAMILYDHLDVSGTGAFGKGSKIETKQCCKLVRGRLEFCNMLKYSTKHYRSAPDKVKAYLSQAPTHTHGK
eukprot:g5744.t1